MRWALCAGTIFEFVTRAARNQGQLDFCSAPFFFCSANALIASDISLSLTSFVGAIDEHSFNSVSGPTSGVNTPGVVPTSD